MKDSSLFIYRILNKANGHVLFSCNPTIAEELSCKGYTVHAKKQTRKYGGWQ